MAFFLKKKPKPAHFQTRYFAYQRAVRRSQKNRPTIIGKTLHIQTASYQQKRPASKIKRLGLIITAGTLIIIPTYIALLSPFFTIKAYQIDTDNSTINANDIVPILKKITQLNLFLIDTDDLQKQIHASFPETSQIDIKKLFPQKLSIKITTWPTIANVINQSLTGDKKFLINEKGILINENTENPTLPYIVLQTEKAITVKTAIMSEEKLKKIIQAMTLFNQVFNLKVSASEYKLKEREIHLKTEKKFYVWLDAEQNIEDQLSKLKLALNKLDIYKTPLSYIDLRIPGTNGEKIFYKKK